MLGDEIAAAIVVCVLFVVMIMISVCISYESGLYDEKEKWKKDTINRGLAQYNQKTGKWEWIEK